MVIERRGGPRIHVVWKATVTRLNGEQLPGSTDNVSREGMNIIVDKALVLGEPVRVSVVSICLGRTCCFTLDGVIVYNHSLDANLGHAIGLRLLKPDEQFMRIIDGLESDNNQVMVS